jgi:glycosyltransferase involved in cell wall biosynthesis
MVQSNHTGAPVVSVVIPTYRRPDSVLRAVASVLAQTFTHFEILVVHDGPGPETAAALKDADPRVRYYQLDANRGPAAARNYGVTQARGQWIGFLDDDDEWLPRKLEVQLAAARPGEHNIILTTRSLYRHGDRSDPWPSRPLAEGEDVGDYILVRPGLFSRPGILSISTFLVPREVLARFPLITAPDHEDWSWILKVAHEGGIRFRFVWESLVVYTIVIDSLSRSRRLNWLESLTWIDQHRPWLSQRAYNSFLSTKIALKVRRQGDWRGFFSLAARVLRNSPSLLDLAFLTGMTLLPIPLLNLAWRRSLKSTESPTLPDPAHQ